MAVRRLLSAARVYMGPPYPPGGGLPAGLTHGGANAIWAPLQVGHVEKASVTC